MNLHFTLEGRRVKKKIEPMPSRISDPRTRSIHKRWEDTEHTSLPPRLERQTGEYTESQPHGAEIHLQKLPWEPVLGQETWTIIDQLLEAQCKQL